MVPQFIILHTKTTASESEAALSYYRLRGLYFPAVVSVRSIHKDIEDTGYDSK